MFLNIFLNRAKIILIENLRQASEIYYVNILEIFCISISFIYLAVPFIKMLKIDLNFTQNRTRNWKSKYGYWLFEWRN